MILDRIILIFICLYYLLIIACNEEKVNSSSLWLTDRANTSRTAYIDTKDISKSPKIYWTAKLGKSALGTPVIDSTQIYICDDEGFIYGLKLDGKLNWKTKLNSKPIGSPTLYENNLYIGTENGTIFSLATVSGDIRWQFKSDSPISSSSLLIDNILYIGCIDGLMLAIDINKGIKLWQYATQGIIYTTPLEARRKQIIITSDDACIYSLDYNKEHLNWRYETGGILNSTPAYNGDYVYFSSSDGWFYALHIISGERYWKQKINSIDFNDVLLVDSLVVVNTDTLGLIALNQNNGNIEYQWNILSSGKSPIASRKFIYIASDKNIYGLKLNNPNPKWNFVLEDTISSDLIICDGILYVGTSNGNLHTLKP